MRIGTPHGTTSDFSGVPARLEFFKLFKEEQELTEELQVELQEELYDDDDEEEEQGLTEELQVELQKDQKTTDGGIDPGTIDPMTQGA